MATEQKGETIQEENTQSYEKSVEENNEEKANYDKYLIALNEYYKLKNDYEGEGTSYFRKKIQIRKDKNLSKSDKYKETQDAKAKRLSVCCNQKGGTIFTQDGNILIAMCNAENKCDLNIMIQKGKVRYINNIDKDIIYNIKKTKQKIISSKLSLLFDLQQEDVVLKEFDDLKDDLDKFNSQLKIVEEKLGDNNSIKVLDPKSGEPKIITKKDFLKSKNRKLNDAIYEFKNRVLKIDDTDTKTIRNAFDTYIDISNIQGVVNDITYDEYFIDFDSEEPHPTNANPYYIIKNENSIQQLEIVAEDYLVMKNEK